ncbi:MAG: adenylosuccinate synthase [Candidatus Syntrophonatronum acetioxidans]|uniref:Adenylosuccinate synthetase n=1 Tax=Candidatus Syntrophonatronum acetioxidans TaxID=1795816 RepID=A0A424YFR4_9FIRM|nr:MAG: adenylosuccinate synthase [Candidatus Syntrophonatronum acetioxidans]
MGTIVVVGTQWGDEGKGKVTDILAEKADMVVRFQGGNNAGHTIVIGEETYKLHLIPSGILNPGKACVLGSGMVVDPAVLLQEMEGLEKRGIDTSSIIISDRAHVIMPYHRRLDELEEERRTKKIGTTKRGIGPCYFDKVSRMGIRMGELIREKEFSQKLEHALKGKNQLLEKVYGVQPMDFKEIFDEYREYAKLLRDKVADASLIINRAVQENKNILFEGAQGAMLDLDYGTYPYVTSSNTLSGTVCLGAGLGPSWIDQVAGIVKAYTTRVGEGPFPTELHGEQAHAIREAGGEYGTTTGRPRRTGWLDTVVLRQAHRLNGLTWGVITKLDVLSGISPLKICTGYRVEGQVLEEWPVSQEVLNQAEPIYEEMKGWSQDLSEIESYQDFPPQARDYVNRISQLTGIDVALVSVGPRRDQTKIIKKIEF